MKSSNLRILFYLILDGMGEVGGIGAFIYGIESAAVVSILRKIECLITGILSV